MYAPTNYVHELRIAMVQNGDVKLYEKKIAQNIETYVDIDEFYELSINNILSIVKNVSSIPMFILK